MAALLRSCSRLKRTYFTILIVLLCTIILYFILTRKPTLDLDFTKRVLIKTLDVSLCAAYNDSSAFGVHNSLEADKRPIICGEIENRLEEELKLDKGAGCDLPDMDVHAPEIRKFNRELLIQKCIGYDWVECKFDKCSLKKSLIEKSSKIQCLYSEIIFANDFSQRLADAVKVRGSEEYTLVNSDFADVECKRTDSLKTSWQGLVHGHRNVSVEQSHGMARPGYNILYFGFDSTSKNGFIRKLPKSYRVLTEELGAVVLNKYNIVGDGTPAALLPILTGRNELELPDVRRKVHSKNNVDDFPFIWYRLRKDGYRTSYSEDSPGTGTFQYRFTGFKNPPTDHYIRPFFQQYNQKFDVRKNPFCVGDTASYQLMMDRTTECMHLPGKKFVFTFVADITHDNFNYLGNAEESFVKWLRQIKEDGVLDNTMLVVFGDHGSRYSTLRNTVVGKLEERLPLMSIVLPKLLIERHPEAYRSLKDNADVLTTPYDLYNTALDLVGLQDEFVQAKIRGADLPRSMSLLRPIPATRSCSEAGIEPHWCTCISWQELSDADPMRARAARAFVDFVNQLTIDVRDKCHKRYLKVIHSVTRREIKQKLLQFEGNKDDDGYTGRFSGKMKLAKYYYQVKVSVGPGNGIYEASLVYLTDNNRFDFNTRDISRTNQYGKEPHCISDARPDLNMFCYCRDQAA